MLLRNAAALLGPGLRHEPRTDILVRGGRFERVGPGAREAARGARALDCEGLLAVPGLVNMHTHVGDSIAKDASPGGPAEARIHPVTGLKPRVLSRTRPSHLAAFARAALAQMLRSGTTTFVDFREGGLPGLGLLREAARGLPIRAIALGRTGLYQTAAEVRSGAPAPPGLRAEAARVARACDGLGISGANENGDAALRAYASAPGLRAIHAAETERSAAASLRMTGRSEAERALLARPHFLVHMTHASPRDLRLAARRARGIVACPRANAALAEGAPDLAAMGRAGCTVALGTDNVMVNPPDMFREMDYAWKTAMAAGRRRADPRAVLAMATVNAGRLLRRPVGSIRRGAAADLVLLDAGSLEMAPVHDAHAAVVHRASAQSVRAVVVGGRVAHGRI